MERLLNLPNKHVIMVKFVCKLQNIIWIRNFSYFRLVQVYMLYCTRMANDRNTIKLTIPLSTITHRTFRAWLYRLAYHYHNHNMHLLVFVFKRLFSRGNRKHFSMPLFSYRNTFRTPEKLKIAYRNTRTSRTCSHAISRFSRTPLVFL